VEVRDNVTVGVPDEARSFPARDLGDPEEAAAAAGEARDEDDRRARLAEEVDRRLLVRGEVAPGRHRPRLGRGRGGPQAAAGRREEERREEKDEKGDGREGRGSAPPGVNPVVVIHRSLGWRV